MSHSSSTIQGWLSINILDYMREITNLYLSTFYMYSSHIAHTDSYLVSTCICKKKRSNATCKCHMIHIILETIWQQIIQINEQEIKVFFYLSYSSDLARQQPGNSDTPVTSCSRENLKSQFIKQKISWQKQKRKKRRFAQLWKALMKWTLMA